MLPGRTSLLAALFCLGWCVTADASDPQSIQEQRTNSRQENDATNLKGATDKACPWGEPVDGIACRLVVQPGYVVGQAIVVAVEVKNVSKRKRYILRDLDPIATEYTSISISGPTGKLTQTISGIPRLREYSFQSIDAGEIKRFDVLDLRWYFDELAAFKKHPNRAPVGKYSLQLRFGSPKIPERFEREPGPPEETSPEMRASQWAHEIVSAPVAFDLLPLAKDDLTVHEWGVFTLINDAKLANCYRNREWGGVPSFFYRQFPQERLRWLPAYWEKPVVYFYAKKTPLKLNVNVTFADGVPVVWWPAVVDPVDEGGTPNSRQLNKQRPYRSLTWTAWLGHLVPHSQRRPGNSFDFYRQYPQERLCWHPAMWNKPVVYFYAKDTPLQLSVSVTFANGLPVVWWPAASDPVDDGRYPNSSQVNKPLPYRSLTWTLWLGQSVPDQRRRLIRIETAPWLKVKNFEWTKVEDFELPADCWLRQARSPDASPLTVVGNTTEIPTRLLPGALDRLETERFLFYDGLVPTPDYLRCENTDSTSVTLRNRARFDIRQLFVVDRRTPGKVGFALLDRKGKAFQTGTTLTMQLREVPKESWPQAGMKQVKQALLDAGLFEAESDALLKIWRDGLSKPRV